MDVNSITIQLLSARFPGQILIPFTAGAEVLGYAPQTARNKLHQGNFPVQTIMDGHRRVIHIEDLATYIDKLRSSSIQPAKVKRGRPTKASQKALQAQVENEARP